MTPELIGQITQGGIAFTVLLAAILYFLKREKKKDEEIEKLNMLLREVEKENLTAMYKVLNYLEKSQEKDESKFAELKLSIEEFRKSIEEKLRDLNQRS